MSVIPGPSVPSDSPPFAVYSFFFNQNTPGLAAGNPVPVLQLQPGQILFDSFIVVLSAFNGVTPKADIGFSESGGTSVFDSLSGGAAPVDLTVVGASFGPSQKANADEMIRLLMNQDPNPPNPSTGVQPPGPSEELSLLVNQTGIAGGAAANPTQGEALLFLTVATPININPTDPPIPSI